MTELNFSFYYNKGDREQNSVNSATFLFLTQKRFFIVVKNVYICEHSLNLIELKTSFLIAFYIYRVTFLVLITFLFLAKFSQLSSVSELTGQLINVAELIEIIMLLS